MARELNTLTQRQYVVTETVQGSFTIATSSKKEAVDIARSLYRSGKLILEPSELIKVKFEAQRKSRKLH